MSLPPNFGFVWKNRVAGSAHPGAGKMLVEHIAGLRGMEVEGILTLTEEGLDQATLSEFGMDWRHLPIDDFAAPTLEQVKQAVAYIDGLLAKDRGVLIHCRAGIGRTGTILAAFLVSRGMEPEKAILEVRSKRPGSIEVYSQEYCVYQYAQFLQKESSPEDSPSTGQRCPRAGRPRRSKQERRR